MKKIDYRFLEILMLILILFEISSIVGNFILCLSLN